VGAHPGSSTPGEMPCLAVCSARAVFGELAAEVFELAAVARALVEFGSSLLGVAFSGVGALARLIGVTVLLPTRRNRRLPGGERGIGEFAGSTGPCLFPVHCGLVD
jgi:hypothetical protein